VGECELRIEAMAKGESGSKARRQLEVKVLQGDVEIAAGQSPSSTDDMNRYLTVMVKQGQLYQIVAFKDGRPTAIQRIQTGAKEESKTVSLQVAL
jgi:hypothetical protein